MFQKKDPEWAVTNFGVLICLQCSGVHRSLGSHISKVKSLQLDKWEPEALLLMRRLGNLKVNQILEENLIIPKLNPTSERQERETFIKAKYQQKQFVGKVTVNTPGQLDKELYRGISDGSASLLDILKLICQGANVDYKKEREKNKTPLIKCIIMDNLLSLELLLQHGANTMLRDDRSWTPLHYCALYNRSFCANSILRFNPDSKYLRDENGQAPLDIAEANHSEEVEALLRTGTFEGLTMEDVLSNDPALTIVDRKLNRVLIAGEEIRTMFKNPTFSLDELGDKLKEICK